MKIGDFLRENEAEFKKAIEPVNQGPGFDEKNEGRKCRDTVPLNPNRWLL
jgi:hypothetical protein